MSALPLVSDREASKPPISLLCLGIFIQTSLVTCATSFKNRYRSHPDKDFWGLRVAAFLPSAQATRSQ